jgi:hypothetical protein
MATNDRDFALSDYFSLTLYPLIFKFSEVTQL